MTAISAVAPDQDSIPPIRVVDGVATEAEISDILDWARAHVGLCEDWLVRRDLLDRSLPDLTTLRRRNANRSAAEARAQVQRLAVARLRTASTSPSADNAVGRILETDLGGIAVQARASGLAVLRLVEAPGLPVPVLLRTSADLFLPIYVSQLIMDASTMFERTQFFAAPPPVTSSWLFFQAISAEADQGDRSRAATAADHLDIRESE